MLEGDFIIKVGSKRFHLQPGDSLLAPRQVPHVWANLGSQHSGSTQAGSLQPSLARARSPALGRMLITFTPAGSMEAFFRKVTAADAMPSQDPALWRAHGMELLGPPLPVA